MQRAAGLVEARCHAVEQGSRALVARQPLPVGIDPVGVVARLADHRQHAAGWNLNHQHRAAPVAECRRGRLLHVEIERGPHVAAGLGAVERVVEQFAPFAAPRLAAEFRIIRRFDPRRAIGEAVIAHRADRFGERIDAPGGAVRQFDGIGQPLAVLIENSAAMDALLLDHVARVVLAGQQAVALDDDPERRAERDPQEADQRGHRDASQFFGHASSLSTSSSPTITKLVSSELPP